MSSSTSSLSSQRENRIEKIHNLVKLGFDPFSPYSQRDKTLAEIKTKFDDLAGQKFHLCGRIKIIRISGKIMFLVVEDESLEAGFQWILKEDLLLGQEIFNGHNLEKSLNFQEIKEYLDDGDYVQGFGELQFSQRGEPSLLVHSLRLLSKCLRPLPEKLENGDLESRYLDRVLDLKMNTKDENGLSVRDIVRIKNTYWRIWREEMQKDGFLEVEIPVLEAIPGGAEAKPFTTFYNEMEEERFLRLSLELPLKKLIAGGFEQVFEIGRVFRNESSSPQHLQEYTSIEFYKAYTDFWWTAAFVKKIYQRIVQEILGAEQQKNYYGDQIDWSDWCSQTEAQKNGWNLVENNSENNSENLKNPENGSNNSNNLDKNNISKTQAGWPAIPYFEAVRHFSDGKIDTENKTEEELLQMCQENGILDVKIEFGKATLLDKLWKIARQNTTNPFFLILPPVELEPLAKRDPKNPKLTQRWQIVAGRAELGKAFSELNDPIDQYERFLEQQKARDAGNQEAQFMDADFVRALEYGLPPLSGFGTSERFVSFLLGKHIKECVTFPQIRNQNRGK